MNIDPTVGRSLPEYPTLIGPATRAEVEGYPGWERLRGQGYSPDPAAIASIREQAAGVEVLVFIGTWCPDSKRHVPRFLKIVDQAGLSESQLRLYGVDRAIDDGGGHATRWNIQRVPTFIFLHQGRELGRVVENPSGTLEGDIARILATR